MGLFRPSRTGQVGRWFEWKVRVFLLGATLGLLGIFLDDHRVILGALGVLAVGVVLRALPDGTSVASDEDDEEEEEDDEEDLRDEAQEPAGSAEDAGGGGVREER